MFFFDCGVRDWSKPGEKAEEPSGRAAKGPVVVSLDTASPRGKQETGQGGACLRRAGRGRHAGPPDPAT